MIEFKTDKPTKTALYLVDRGMQGKAYRFYNAETDKWGGPGYDMNDALEAKDSYATYETIGFFPWAGPLTGPNLKLNEPVPVIDTEDAPKVKKQSKRMAKKVPSKLAEVHAAAAVEKVKKVKVAKTKGAKVTHPDGTVFYRADRNKWVAMWGQKQEAARPTAEACMAFLKKKYNFEGVVLK